MKRSSSDPMTWPSMQRRVFIPVLMLASMVCPITPAAPQDGQRLRPPAVPLVTSDPYFSIWSFSDRLTDAATRHWTGAEQRLESMVRIDGEAYRLLGSEPARVPPLPQTTLE